MEDKRYCIGQIKKPKRRIRKRKRLKKKTINVDTLAINALETAGKLESWEDVITNPRGYRKKGTLISQ